jgi:hypothetical protein
MGRTVSAAVTWGDTYLGVIGPFPVSVPWWAEVEPVVAHLREVLGVPVLVLRLLLVEGGEGARDGHVTYHVAALDRPAPGLLAERPPIDHAAHVVLNGPEEPRSPWARLEGTNEVLTWATDTLAAAARRSSWTGRTLISATRCLTGCGPATSCPRPSSPPPPGPGSTPGHPASPGATRPGRYPSSNRSPISSTPCATRNSSTASSHRNGSTTSAIPRRLSVPHCASP